jgi:hypothetical protein
VVLFRDLQLNIPAEYLVWEIVTSYYSLPIHAMATRNPITLDHSEPIRNFWLMKQVHNVLVSLFVLQASHFCPMQTMIPMNPLIPLIPVWCDLAGLDWCGCDARDVPPRYQWRTLVPSEWLTLTSWCKEMSSAVSVHMLEGRVFLPIFCILLMVHSSLNETRRRDEMIMTIRSLTHSYGGQGRALHLSVRCDSLTC